MALVYGTAIKSISHVLIPPELQVQASLRHLLVYRFSGRVWPAPASAQKDLIDLFSFLVGSNLNNFRRARYARPHGDQRVYACAEFPGSAGKAAASVQS